MKLAKKTASLMLIFISISTSAQDLFLKKSLFSSYEPVKSKLSYIDQKDTLGEYPILKTGEKMRLMFSKVNYSTGTVVPLGRAFMFSEKNKKFHVGIDMTANLQQTNMSDWTDTPCKREDFLWKRSIGGEFKDVNCVAINHSVNYFVTPTGDFQQILVMAKDEGIEFPPTIIRVTFTRYSSDAKRLVYAVEVNPEHYGIERDATTPWGSNGWYKDFISRDQKRVDFLEGLKRWAIDVQERMDLAFKKNLTAFDDLKPIEEYFTGNKITKSADLVGGHKMEEKLISLKSLFEKGLLTESLYNEQVKAVLNGN